MDRKTTAAETSKRMVRSKEVLAVMRIEQILDSLTPEQQARVFLFFADRQPRTPAAGETTTG